MLQYPLWSLFSGCLPAQIRLLGPRHGEMISFSFPMSSLLYNSFVDNDVVHSDNGLKQQSMHGLIIPGSPGAVVEVVISPRRVWRVVADF